MSQPLAALLSRFGHFLSLLACIYLVGGHWAVLQSVAWVGMLADYGRNYGVGAAVVMTFDGAHPCSICRSIQKKKDRQQQELPGSREDQAAAKAKFFPPRAIALVPAVSCSRIGWMISGDSVVSRRDAPPQPVPRVWS